MDYQGNAKKQRTNPTEPGVVKPEGDEKAKKKIEKVVVTEVIVQKKGLGRKFKETFIAGDPKGTAGFVFSNVLIPAARNMIVDAVYKGIDRLMYGDRSRGGSPYGGSSRYTSYNDPINRSSSYYGPPASNRYAPGVQPGPRARERSRTDDFVIASKEEADIVVERMNDCIDMYEVVSVFDLKELLGLPTDSVDNKWGWTVLGNVPVRQVREGYLIELPPANPL